MFCWNIKTSPWTPLPDRACEPWHPCRSWRSSKLYGVASTGGCEASVTNTWPTTRGTCDGGGPAVPPSLCTSASLPTDPSLDVALASSSTASATSSLALANSAYRLADSCFAFARASLCPRVTDETIDIMSESLELWTVVLSVMLNTVHLMTLPQQQVLNLSSVVLLAVLWRSPSSKMYRSCLTTVTPSSVLNIQLVQKRINSLCSNWF